MFEKEVKLKKALDYTWSESLSLFSFLNDEIEEIDYKNRYEESENILNQGGIIFITFGVITNGAEEGEKGTFYIEGYDGSDEIKLDFDECWDGDIWEGKPYKTGGFGFFVKKIYDKYYCEYGISEIESGVVCFAGFSINFEYLGDVNDDPIGFSIKKALDGLKIY